MFNVFIWIIRYNNVVCVVLDVQQEIDGLEKGQSRSVIPLGFVIMLGKLLQFCFYNHCHLSLQNQLVGKPLVIHQKSAKTAKVFSRVTFVIYGN